MNLNLKPIEEHSYSWTDGFLLAGMPERPEGMRQIDWETVKQIINSKEYERIELGLAEDYYHTHAVIFEDSELVIKENDGAGFYGASRWATPSIKLTKNGKTEVFECWVSGNETGFPSWLTKSAKKN